LGNVAFFVPLLAAEKADVTLFQPELILRGEHDMTKAKARQRAKAKAAEKTGKRETNTGRHDQKVRPGQFDPGTGSIKSPSVNAGGKNFAGARRGAARSR
jgi:hypothetical protein